MTLLAYLLVASDHGQPEVRRAGWIYLVASHVAVLALMALFLAWGRGSLDFAAFPPAAPALMPKPRRASDRSPAPAGAHVWLPEAHAAAPSHVSALMSGSLVTLGVYGLARVGQLGRAGAGFGVALMVLGAAGALLGIALALVQRDLKRVLAYSTVENMGLVLLGLGLGFWSRAHGEPRIAALAFAAALLHVWNHAAMKGLLFLSAGGVVHATGTRDLERTGGLLRRMPWSGGTMLVGAVAIAGLPPLAGFSGEWLLYRALSATAVDGTPATGLAAIGGAAVLALTAGLALLCFVRLAGVALLGTARSAEAAAAHEAPPAMTVPMIALAALCLAGVPAAPRIVELMTPLLRSLGAPAVDSAASSLPELALASVALLLLVAGGAAFAAWRLRRAPVSETWGCGYAAPEPRMQYAAGGFSELLATRILPRWLRPRPSLRAPEGLLPRAASFASDTADPLTRAVYEPGLVRIGDRFARLRFLQQGNVHLYLLYVLVTTVLALGWVALRDWWRP